VTPSLVQCIGLFWCNTSSCSILVRMKISSKIKSSSMTVYVRCIPLGHVFLDPCLARIREVRSCRISSHPFLCEDCCKNECYFIHKWIVCFFSDATSCNI